MKKLLVIVLSLICLVSLVGCNEQHPNNNETSAESQESSSELPKEEQISDYIVEEDGRKYLVLPISGYKMRWDEDYEPYLDQIDLDALRTAEENLNSKIEMYEATPVFWLQIKDDCLYLWAEMIVYKEIPGPGGCFDHDHIMFEEKLVKQ